MLFVGHDEQAERMEIVELKGNHPSLYPSFRYFRHVDLRYFVGVQYHPEYLTRPMKPSPPYLGLILAACNKLDLFISRGCLPSPRSSYEYDYDTDLDDEVTQAFRQDPFKSSSVAISPMSLLNSPPTTSSTTESQTNN